MPGTETNLDPRNYEELTVLGKGAYGTVFKARDLANNGQIVALKKVRVPLTDEGIPMSTIREIALLRQLDEAQHPNVIRLLDICHGQRLEKEKQLVLFLVFEHVDQDLATYLDRCPPPGLSSSTVKDLMYQLLSGVDYLHSNRIVHRDIKPENILVTNAGEVKLADFGLAKTYDFEMRLTSVVVTLWYRSPEVLLGQPYGTPVDMWSCGCIFGELFRRSPICSGSSEGDQLDRIFRVIGTPKKHEWPENVSLSWSSFDPNPGLCLETFLPELGSDGEHLFENMLTFDPLKRIKALDALNHQYFKQSGYNYPSNIPAAKEMVRTQSQFLTPPIEPMDVISSSAGRRTANTTSASGDSENQNRSLMQHDGSMSTMFMTRRIDIGNTTVGSTSNSGRHNTPPLSC